MVSDTSTTFRAQVAHVQSRLTFESDALVRLNARMSQISDDKTLLVKAQALIDATTSAILSTGIGKIESIVTGGLRLVFNDPTMAFIIEKKEGARGVSYRFKLKKNKTTGDPLTMFGGGPISVACLLLRVILIKRFKLAKFMLIDENLHGVSPNFQPKTSELLSKLCSSYGYTIFLVTQSMPLADAADKIYIALPDSTGDPNLHDWNTLSAEDQEVVRNSMIFGDEGWRSLQDTVHE